MGDAPRSVFLQLVRQSPQPALIANKKTPPGGGGDTIRAGRGGRTYDLRVMSPTSYQTAPPRNVNACANKYYTSQLSVSQAKSTIFSP